MTFALMAVSVVCQVVAQNLMRAIQARSRNVYLSVLSNYVAALLLAGLWCWLRGIPASWWRPIAAGLFTGTFYLAGLVMFLRSMGQRGLAMSSAISATSALVPVGLAILLGERPGGVQVGGMAVALAAMPLLSLATATGEAVRERPNAVFAFLFFLTQGGAMSGNLFAFKFLDPSSLPLYLVAVFAWGTALGLVLWRVQRREEAAGDVWRGASFGVFNLASTISIVLALRYVSGYLFFSVVSVLILVANLGVAAWLWRERVGRVGWVGLALAAVATLLLNLQ